MNTQVKDIQKSLTEKISSQEKNLQDKMTSQEKNMKEVSDKIGDSKLQFVHENSVSFS